MFHSKIVHCISCGHRGDEACHLIWYLIYPVATVLQTCVVASLLVTGSVVVWHGELEQSTPALYYPAAVITVVAWLLIPCPRLVCGSMLSLVGCYCPRSEDEVDDGFPRNNSANQGGVVVDESGHPNSYGSTEPSKTAASRDNGIWENLIMKPREAFFEPFRQRLAVINNRAQTAPR